MTTTPVEVGTRLEPSVRPATQRPRQRNRFLADLRGLYIIWFRDVLRWWRDRQRILPSLVQPILYLFIFGVGLGSALGGGLGAASGGRGLPGVSYTTFMYPGILAMSVLFTSIFSAMSIVWDREFGFLKEIQVAPISRTAVAIGKALGGSTVAMLQASLLLVVAPLVGVHLDLLLVLEIWLLLFLLAFALSAMGVAIASRLRSMEGFQVVMNFVMMPLLFLSGAFFPLNGLPPWLAALTRIDPAAYAVDGLRRVTLNSSGVPDSVLAGFAIHGPSGEPIPILLDAIVLIVFSVPAVFLAVRWFGRSE